MSPAGSLKDQEEAAASSAGNADDGVNPGQQAYEDLFDGDGSDTETDAHGDTIQRNYNADSEEDRQSLQDKESNPGFYSGGGSSGGGMIKNPRLLLKKYGASGGVVGMLIAGITGSAAMSPFSLLTSFSDLSGNHAGLNNHLFMKSGNSYMASLLKGQTRNCATATIKCKLTTISEKQLKEWKSRGIDVKADKTVFGRYKIRTIEYKNTKITNIRDFKNVKNIDVNLNSLMKRFPVRAYLNEKGPFRKGTLAKFGKSLVSDRLKSSTDKDKSKREEANKKAMNEKTKAPVDDKGKVTVEKLNSQAEEKVKKASNPMAEKIKGLKGLKTGAKVGNGVTTGIVAGCMIYNVIRAAQAAVILYWHMKLIDFVLPLLIAGSQAKEDGVNNPGAFTWQDAEMFGDWLTKPITQKDVDENPDMYSQSMVGKTAMDSKGVDAMINGGTGSLSSGYAQKYTGWWPSVIGTGVVKKIQEVMGGKENIRVTCKAAHIAAFGSCAGNLPSCALAAGVFSAVGNAIGPEVLEYAMNQIKQPAMEAIAKSGLNSDLHGPPLGQALVGGAGVLAMYSDGASGLGYAGTNGEVAAAYNDMYADQDYMQSVLADGRQKAAENQLDPTNKYSFAGQLASTLSTTPYDGTLFSAFANMIGITVRSPLLIQSASAMTQGLYQPIEVLNSADKLAGTLNNCKSPGLTGGDFGLDIPCLGEAGRPVPKFMPNVEDCMKKELEDEVTVCIATAIDYLSTHEYGEGESKAKYVDNTSGEPTEWSSFSAVSNVDSGTEKDYKNPFLMYMQYCGRDRIYPIGYTDKGVDDDADDWHSGLNCVQGKNTLGGDGRPDDELLGWMGYYYHMCIAMYASEGDQDYCWDNTATPQSVTQPVSNPQAAATDPNKLPDGTKDEDNVIKNQFCEVNYSTATDLRQQAVEMATICSKVVPLLQQQLGCDITKPPFKVTFQDGNGIADATASDGTVRVYNQAIRKNPGDSALIAHELTHLCQGGSNSWAIEAMADYMRNKMGYGGDGFLHCNPGDKYDNGGRYRCGGALIEYGARLNPELPKMINGNYGDVNGAILRATGKTVEQLYAECLKDNLCKGGSP